MNSHPLSAYYTTLATSYTKPVLFTLWSTTYLPGGLRNLHIFVPLVEVADGGLVLRRLTSLVQAHVRRAQLRPVELAQVDLGTELYRVLTNR